MTIYDNMQFEPYKYVEYPKIVDVPGGGRQQVENAAEEAKVLQGAKIVREGEERGRLILEARNKGIQIDESWSLDRIQEEIEIHDAAVTMARANIKAQREAREEKAAKVLAGEPDGETERLRTLAEKHGVKIDKRWGDEKIVAALREAGVDESEAA